MKRLSRLAIAALLAAAVAPAFARGQPQLPDDDGGRASVLHELNPTRVTDTLATRARLRPNRSAIGPPSSGPAARPNSAAPSSAASTCLVPPHSWTSSGTTKPMMTVSQPSSEITTNVRNPAH